MAETEDQNNSGGQEIPMPEWLKNPPDWLKNPPASNSTESSTPASGVSPGSQQRTEILNQLNTLPDKIVDSIREAFPSQSATPASTESDQSKSGDNAGESSKDNTNSDRRPGPQSFTEWWFGG